MEKIVKKWGEVRPQTNTKSSWQSMIGGNPKDNNHNDELYKNKYLKYKNKYLKNKK